MKRVAVLLEAPRPAFVPPALVEALGAAHAVRLRRVVARRTLLAVREAGGEPIVWFTPPDALGEMRRWLGLALDFRPHHDRSPIPLVSELAAEGAWLLVRPAGAGITLDLLAEAGRALQDGRPVFGATTSGELYLLGGPPAFAATAAEVPWGEPGVAVRFRERLAAEHGAPPCELAALRDVRTPDDARAAGLLT
ncbi:MAG TPA: hypothetical protein VFX50_04780 [Gemmatimonadales bacterium]|nr:hypothetical protein [Gemmatimonadales bacterium]